MLYASPVPILVAALAFVLFSGLRDKRELSPFLASLGLFVLSYIGIGISFYPYIVPTSITIWEAAAPDNSLEFLLVGALRAGADDPRLHRLFLLGVSRQGERPCRGLPLMASRARAGRCRNASRGSSGYGR